ncbi:MAG: hypothetical protein MR893_03965 [Prevotellaceae bacterium]|nr:hypothetical protein [Prevotellaceae bacterium]
MNQKVLLHDVLLAILDYDALVVGTHFLTCQIVDGIVSNFGSTNAFNGSCAEVFVFCALAEDVRFNLSTTSVLRKNKVSLLGCVGE